MTDPTPLSDEELDLAASLAIDGQEWTGRPIPAGDRPRIDARAAELRAAVVHVGEPVVVPGATERDRQIAAALAAASTGATTATGTGTTAHLALRRSRRRRLRTAAPWVAAAAAAAVVVVMVAALAGRSTSRDASTSLAETGASASRASSTSARPSSPGELEPTVGVTAPPDLGTFADADALDARVRTIIAKAEDATLGTGNTPQAKTYSSSNTPSGPALAQADRCATAIGTLRPVVGRIALETGATLGSRPVAIVVFDPRGTSAGPRRLVVFDAGNCRVLVDRPL